MIVTVNYSGHMQSPDGEQKWFKRGILHRDDGPAFIDANQREYWYQHGKLHRDDGPATVYPNGYREWYSHGKLHRIGGPAVIWADGTEHWFINGQYITDQIAEWLQRNGFSGEWTEEMSVMAKLTWGSQ